MDPFEGGTLIWFQFLFVDLSEIGTISACDLIWFQFLLADRSEIGTISA